jgi:hypothetical protein
MDRCSNLNVKEKRKRIKGENKKTFFFLKKRNEIGTLKSLDYNTFHSSYFKIYIFFLSAITVEDVLQNLKIPPVEKEKTKNMTDGPRHEI